MRARIRTDAFGITEAHIHMADWSALVTDGELSFRFLYGDYQFLEWLEADAPDVEPECKCDLKLSWRCYCGAVEPYKAPR